MERTKGAELWLALMLSSVTPGSLLLNGGTGKFGIWFCSQGKLEFMAEPPCKASACSCASSPCKKPITPRDRCWKLDCVKCDLTVNTVVQASSPHCHHALWAPLPIIWGHHCHLRLQGVGSGHCPREVGVVPGAHPRTLTVLPVLGKDHLHCYFGFASAALDFGQLRASGGALAKLRLCPGYIG